METKLHGIIHQILQIKITDFIFLVYQNRSLHLGIDHSNQLIRWNRLGKQTAVNSFTSNTVHKVDHLYGNVYSPSEHVNINYT